MLNRRAVSIGLCLEILGVGHVIAAGDDDWQQVLTEALRANDPTTLGRLMLPKDSPLWQVARQQMAQAAQQHVPYLIAKYFVTSLPKELQTAWPEPDPKRPTLANPLIVLFFLATHTTPSGDKTAWCSAFMNWCLTNASPSIQGTANVGSQSWIDPKKPWGKEVWNKRQAWPPVAAQQGDIAVFTHKSDPTHGHVAFFDRATPNQPNHIDVLGGNQFDKAGLHTFSVKSLNIHADLELSAILTAEGLHRA